MQIMDVLSTENIILELAVQSRQALFQALSAEAASRVRRSEQDIFDALQAREQLGSTALGRGVALPHARFAGDDPPAMLFTRLRRPIDFEARDDEPVDLVFLLLWPEASPEGFLQALSQICQMLREPKMPQRLRQAQTPEEVLAVFREAVSPPAARTLGQGGQ